MSAEGKSIFYDPTANSGYKVTRVVNGESVEIELSVDELSKAFNAYQDMSDKDDVEAVIEVMEEDLNKEFDLANNPLTDDEIVQIAENYRIDFDNDENAWASYCKEAIREFLINREKQLDKAEERE